MWKFSRSHQGSLHECPRLAWLRYFDRGRGWESTKLNVEQSMGSLAHSMLATILQWVRAFDSKMVPGEEQISRAVEEAVKEYKLQAAKRGLDIEQEGDQLFELTRQSALAEGLVRAWVKVKLPDLLDRFKVLSIEEEWDVPLSPTITIMMRLDALLEQRDTLDLWPLEFKTSGMISDSWLESWRYDSQTLQQVWATETHLPRPCAGVQLEVLYKGAKRSDGMGKMHYYSPLIRGYQRKGIPPFDEDELSWDSGMGKRKGWSPVDVWQWGKVKEWVELLPVEVLQAQLFSREIFRSGREQETWVGQTLLEQKMVMEGVECVLNPETTPHYREQAMDIYFPARLSRECYSNKYRRKCMFLDVCYNGIDPSEDPRFTPRTPHHVQESEE